VKRNVVEEKEKSRTMKLKLRSGGREKPHGAREYAKDCWGNSMP
jgi:hypothetical protein